MYKIGWLVEGTQLLFESVAWARTDIRFMFVQHLNEIPTYNRLGRATEKQVEEQRKGRNLAKTMTL